MCGREDDPSQHDWIAVCREERAELYQKHLDWADLDIMRKPPATKPCGHQHWCACEKREKQ